MTCERLQRFGCLLGSLDIGLALRVKRRRRGQDDRPRDDVRERHPEKRVETDARKLSRRLLRRLLHRVLWCVAFDFLDLLRSLPKEQVWADRRTEDGDQRGEVFWCKPYRRNERLLQRRGPWHVDDECGHDVG